MTPVADLPYLDRARDVYRVGDDEEVVLRSKNDRVEDQGDI